MRCEMLCARKRFFVCCLMQNNVDIRNIYLSGLAAVICATIESLNEKSRAYSLARALPHTQYKHTQFMLMIRNLILSDKRKFIHFPFVLRRAREREAVSRE